jgi:acylphosphatase
MTFPYFMNKTHERLHATVYGIVQGVFFRDATETRAKQLGVSGWVRNLPDGSVEVVAEGPRAALQELVGFLREGPPEANVTEVHTDWAAASGEFRFFEVNW